VRVSLAPGGVAPVRAAFSGVWDRGRNEAAADAGRIESTSMRRLSDDLSDPEARPYFLWDEDVSLAEFKRRLRSADGETRLQTLAKLLREARDTDVWIFVTPQDVADSLPSLDRKLGRRQRFWSFLIEGWRRLGIVHG